MSGPTRLVLPNDTPAAVLAAVRWIGSHPLVPDHADVLVRLATNPRMARVWGELARQVRPGGGFLHPARPPAHAPARPPVEAQEDALGETLHFAWAAACGRVRVAKIEDVEAERAALINRARALRVLAGTSRCKLDASALGSMAASAEAATATLRGLDDPLMIANDRGDRVMRGVQTIIGAFLLARFGNRLDRTAAALASVALDVPTSARATRSAFSGRATARNRGKKQTARE